MRSRYSAYALGGYGEYLLKTWFAPMAKGLNAGDLSQLDQQWLGLIVLGSGVAGNEGWVEFKASYRDNNDVVEMHEKSVFTKVADRWFYIGGEVAHTKTQKQ
jgi:SEC-C motif-containing protein